MKNMPSGLPNIWLERSPDFCRCLSSFRFEPASDSYLLRVTLARAEDAQGKTDEALSTARELLQMNPGHR